MRLKSRFHVSHLVWNTVAPYMLVIGIAYER
jgi:hypothetical protein